jgi:hypothetical protein
MPIPGHALLLAAAGGGSADPVLPIQTNLIFWYDANDFASFSFGSGSNVSQWSDRSGNGNHLVQATDGLRPQRTGTLNGRSTVDFDGTDNWMVSTGNVTLPGDQSFYIVVEPDTNNNDIVFEHSANWNSFSGQLFTVDSSTQWGSGIRRAGGTADAKGFTTRTAGAHLISVTMDGTHANHAMWQDGAALTGATAASQNDNEGTGTANTGLYVGSRNGSGFFFDGKIAEFIMYDATHNTTDRQTIETYLLDKWGL